MAYKTYLMMTPEFFNEYKLNLLARKMQKGDESAAGALYDELSGKVFGFCVSRVRSRNTAEDLTQDIFLKLISRIQTFDPNRGAFSAWFWKLARNTVIDYYRNRERKNTAFSDIPEENVENLGSYDTRKSSEQKIEWQRVAEFLDSLSRDEKELFESRFVADLPYKEISRVVGKNEAALRVAATRLKQKVRKHFKTAP